MVWSYTHKYTTENVNKHQNEYLKEWTRAFSSSRATKQITIIFSSAFFFVGQSLILCYKKVYFVCK